MSGSTNFCLRRCRTGPVHLLRKLIKDGLVEVNGKQVKANYKLGSEDEGETSDSGTGSAGYSARGDSS